MCPSCGTGHYQCTVKMLTALKGRLYAIASTEGHNGGEQLLSNLVTGGCPDFLADDLAGAAADYQKVTGL
jgi:hypothetical protein